MIRDDQRNACIEAMKAAGRAAIDRGEFDNLIEKLFDALHGLARVVPPEATREMCQACDEYDLNVALEIGDLTNPPGEKP